MSEQMRSEFEAWLSDGNSSGCNNVAWQAWQASRAALCVELPANPNEEFSDRASAVESCRSAIHAAGVKTK